MENVDLWRVHMKKQLYRCKKYAEKQLKIPNKHKIKLENIRESMSEEINKCRVKLIVLLRLMENETQIGTKMGWK